MHLQLPNQVSQVLNCVVQQAYCFRERRSMLFFWYQRSAFTCLFVEFRMASCKLGKVGCCATHRTHFAEVKADGYPSQTCVSRGMEEDVSLSQYGEKSKREGVPDEMIEQVVLYCMMVKHLIAGCMEQMSQGTGLWIISIAATPLPPQSTILPKFVFLAE